MIRSMTGYGRKELKGAAGSFVVEIRSVNNRYIDIQVKAPRSLAVLESRIKKAIQEHFSRGRFDVYVTRNGDEGAPGRLALDHELAGQYISVLRELKAKYSLPGEVDLTLLTGIPDIITKEEVREDSEAVWKALSEGLSQAMEELHAMRAEEGAALGRDILSRLETIEGLIRAVRTQAPRTVEHARKRMNDALNKVLAEQPDPARLAQEIAVLAERTDVTEELTRLDSHLRQFRAMLDDRTAEAVGRKLDFLLQEMGREANTIASKAMDASISLDVVNIKAELEKIREQVQNIE